MFKQLIIMITSTILGRQSSMSRKPTLYCYYWNNYHVINLLGSLYIHLKAHSRDSNRPIGINLCTFLIGPFILGHLDMDILFRLNKHLFLDIFIVEIFPLALRHGRYLLYEIIFLKLNRINTCSSILYSFSIKKVLC